MPVVAAIQGACFGGGLEIATMTRAGADVRECSAPIDTKLGLSGDGVLVEEMVAFESEFLVGLRRDARSGRSSWSVGAASKSS